MRRSEASWIHRQSRDGHRRSPILADVAFTANIRGDLDATVEAELRGRRDVRIAVREAEKQRVDVRRARRSPPRREQTCRHAREDFPRPGGREEWNELRSRRENEHGIEQRDRNANECAV